MKGIKNRGDKGKKFLRAKKEIIKVKWKEKSKAKNNIMALEEFRQSI